MFLSHKKSGKSGSASISDVVAYFLKFQYLTDVYVRIRMSRNQRKRKELPNSDQLYQNYLEDNDEEEGKNENIKDNDSLSMNSVNGESHSKEDSYCSYIDKALFGPVVTKADGVNVIIKPNNKGLVPKIVTFDDEKRPSEEIIKHNLQKVHFYEQSPECTTLDDIFVSFYSYFVCILIYSRYPTMKSKYYTYIT